MLKWAKGYNGRQWDFPYRCMTLKSRAKWWPTPRMPTPNAHGVVILAINPNFCLENQYSFHTDISFQGNFGNHGYQSDRKPDQNSNFKKNANFEVISIFEMVTMATVFISPGYHGYRHNP